MEQRVVTENITKGGVSVSKQQAAVVESVLENDLTIVSAGAGSGKTHTSTAAVLELLDNGYATIDQIILITYTNTAADNIRARLEKEMKKKSDDPSIIPDKRAFWRKQIEKTGSAFIGTIHSFCKMVLTTFGYNQLVARTSDITFSTYLRNQVITEALNIHVQSTKQPKLILPEGTLHDYELKGLLIESLEYIYNQGYDMHEVYTWTENQPKSSDKDYRMQFMRMLNYINEKYIDKKQKKPALDSHDLLSLTNRLLNDPTDGPCAISKLTKRYKYLFVDEFQDTNKLQLNLIEKLLPISKETNLENSLTGVLLVGDQKQSIFGFSGANSSLLKELAAKRNKRILPLNVARRPTEDYLSLINTIFEVVGHRVPQLNDKMYPAEDTFKPTEPIQPLTFLTCSQDASIEEKGRAIANHIQSLLQRPIHPDKDSSVRMTEPGDIVILTRGNKQLNDYLTILRRELPDIEFRSDRGDSFFQKPEIVATYRLLRAIIHYPDDYILSQSIGAPYLMNIDAQAMENHLIHHGKASGNPLTNFLKHKYPEAFSKIDALRKRVKVDTVPHFLETLYRYFDVRTYYKSSPDAILALEQLREKARNLFDNDQALTLRTFVDYLERNISSGQATNEVDLDIDDKHKRINHIRLMTIHRSKGLEFKIVIIPDAQKEVIKKKFLPKFMVIEGHGIEVNLNKVKSVSPRYWDYINNMRINQFEEEMRIFYVAITRAEQSVTLIGTPPSQTAYEPATWNSWQDPIWWCKVQRLLPNHLFE